MTLESYEGLKATKTSVSVTHNPLQAGRTEASTNSCLHSPSASVLTLASYPDLENIWKVHHLPREGVVGARNGGKLF